MAADGEESPVSELSGLQMKVGTLKKKLRMCKSEIHKLQKKLCKSRQQQEATERYNDDLRTQVDKLSAEIHGRKQKEKNRVDAETQTDNYSSWTESDYYNYYYGTYYQSGSEPSEVQTETNSEMPNNSETTDTSGALTGHVPDCAHSTEDSGIASKSEDTNGTSIADMIRATAEEAVSQTGFVFDEASGMYYDHSTGFYYDSSSQLYYDANTGMYYYYDTDSGRYQFHSRVEMQPYQATTEPSQDKKSKKRKGTERSTPKDKSLRAETDMEECESKRAEQMRKRILEYSEDGEVERAEDSKRGRCAVRSDPSNHWTTRSCNSSSESEPEEGEIRESDGDQDSYSDPSAAADGSGSEEEELEVQEEAWPPCVRVTVVRSPVLQTGTLYIITADTPATIGREKDMDHTIRIPEMGVSKFHAEVRFDPDLQCYLLVDQGSQNGTVINGNRILQPKTKCEPCVLAHGDEIKMGETVLSFHIHPGNETCDGCEPGQVIAHLSRNRKDETSGAVLPKEDKEIQRLKELKQMKVKYGLTNSEYEGAKALKNSKYKDRAEERRQVVGSEGTFQRDDAPASVHVEIGDSNKGRKMLEKMGWKKGEGLGKDGAGRKDPIKLQIRKSQAGLGVNAAVSVEDITLPSSKNQKNWEKARERFADMCQPPASTKNEKNKPKSWVKSDTTES
ncbi:angiogenic factor with G patch and FHA domains 1 isoform X1 [Scleropages formosus]|uniref:Angiogenic factor with G patch and FHA domains 1 n=1 Tax=Scleropages formosus TaxID=113540 RepID=A0A8C9S6S3_SCLFO|nr:angiogenic factor with G patch and FHA domains 1 isoform X1 [Scleropages formosus]